MPMPFKNGRGVLPDHVSYRWVVKKEGVVYPLPILTFVTSACNHCEHPACLASCPVSDANDFSNESNAIFKREADGIVLINQRFASAAKTAPNPALTVLPNSTRKLTACR